MMNTNPPGIERPRYFHGQLLTAQDFIDEQDYFREKLRRHNRLLHGWGVVCGLRVTPAEQGCEVIVAPGYALDPCGDEVLVEEEILLRLSRPEGVEGDGPEAAESDAASCPDGAWTVAIRYVEIPARFVPVMGGSPDTDALQASRTRESYELCAFATLPALPAGYDPGSKRWHSGASGVCPSCPPDPEARWVVLAEVKVQGGRVTVKDTRA
jgi:hypothetical protein